MTDELNVVKKNWYDDGVYFKCTSCGKCCTGKGGIVSLSELEAKNIAKFLSLSFEEFLSLYCEKRQDRYILKDSPGTDSCIFLKEKKCQVYMHRPAQCKTFPYWPSIMRTQKNWDSEERSCEGINHPDAELVKLETIQKNLKIMEDR